MLTSSIASERYALAFFNLALEKNIVAKVQGELAEIVSLFKENADLKQLLFHPRVSKDDKKQVLRKIMAGYHVYTENLLLLLVDKGRLPEIKALAKHFESLWQKEQGVATAEITAAFPLGKDLEERLQKKLTELANKKINLQITIDENIIGGLIIKLGDLLIDGSIRRDLEKLKERLNSLRVGKVG